jgi:hypothetical protein
MVEPRANIGRELVRRVHEVKKCRRVSLMLGEICEHAELLCLVLRPRYSERECMLGSIGRRFDNASQVVAYELTRPFVALYEIWLATHSDGEYQGRLNLVRKGSGDYEIVDRMVRGLLECDTDDATFAAKFGGRVADQQVGQVHHRNLSLEGHSTTARRVWIRSCRQRAVLRALRPCLVVAGPRHQISSECLRCYEARTRGERAINSVDSDRLARMCRLPYVPA